MQTRNSAPAMVIYSIFLILIAITQAAADESPIVREQKTLIVDGKPEIWRLEWERKPVSVCGAEEEDMALTCPCSGFAFAEQAPLALVRTRADGTTERLELGSLFEKDNPVVGAGDGQAILQRWAPVETAGPNSDFQHAFDDHFAAKVARRPMVDVMKIADFDHDGRATEFLFQVATLPCGKHQMVLVGISKSDPHLHIFSSAENPQTPLILGDWEWAALRQSSGPVDVIDWHCQDHGNDQEQKVHLSASSGLIHASMTSRQCPDQTKSEAYKEILKLNEMHDKGQVPNDEFVKRKLELIKQLPNSPQ
jgi:hypothetical protein